MTLRELMWSADERQKTEWDRTCEIVAMLVNCAAKKHVFSARNINPFRGKAAPRPLMEGDLDDLLEL